jgi:hypothetical protein
MSSSTPSFDSSFVLKFSGASSTSPSRLPRMFVEYQPDTPSWRAFTMGASTVFMRVWPVLKSLPEIGTLFFTDSSRRTGVSTARFGDPLANGTPSRIAAYAYSIAGETVSSFASIAASSVSTDWCAGPGSMKISVLAHQIMTTRSTFFSSRNALMSARIAFSMSRLLPGFTCSPVRLRAYLRSNAAFIGRMSRSTSLMASMCLPCSSTPAREAAT